MMSRIKLFLLLLSLSAPLFASLEEELEVVRGAYKLSDYDVALSHIATCLTETNLTSEATYELYDTYAKILEAKGDFATIESKLSSFPSSLVSVWQIKIATHNKDYEKALKIIENCEQTKEILYLKLNALKAQNTNITLVRDTYKAIETHNLTEDELGNLHLDEANFEKEHSKENAIAALSKITPSQSTYHEAIYKLSMESPQSETSISNLIYLSNSATNTQIKANSLIALAKNPKITEESLKQIGGELDKIILTADEKGEYEMLFYEILSTHTNLISYAAERLEKLVHDRPKLKNAPKYLLKSAEGWYAISTYERAKNNAQKALKNYKNATIEEQIKLHQIYGDATLCQKNYAQATTSFNLAKELATTHNFPIDTIVQIQEKIALSSELAGLYEIAVQEYSKLPITETRLLKIAEMQEKSSNREEAATSYYKFSNTYTNSPHLSFALERAVALTQNPKSAIAIYEKLYQISSKEKQKSLIPAYANLLIETGDFIKSREILNELTTEDSTLYDDAAMANIKTYENSNDLMSAIEFAKEFIQRTNATTRAEVLFWLAQTTLMQTQNTELNAKGLTKATIYSTIFAHDYPEDDRVPTLLLLEANILSKKGNSSEAIAKLSKIRKQYPTSPIISEIYYRLAAELFSVRRYEDAIREITDNITKVQNDTYRLKLRIIEANSYFALGGTENKEENLQNAVEIYAEIIENKELPSTNLEYLFKEARALELLDRQQEAEKIYKEKIIERYTNKITTLPSEEQDYYIRAIFNLANYYEEKCKINEAQKLLSLIIEQNLATKDEAQAEIQRLISEN